MDMTFSVVAVAVAAVLVQAVQQWPITDNVCQIACQKLSARYPSQVSFPNDESYQIELSSYWSLQQAQTLPACIFFPRNAKHIASVVNVSRGTQCPFAAKSGGHVPFAGASNIAGGITIDLSGLDDIVVHQEKNTISVGAGNKWVDVYRELEKYHITVVGGRIADVGVGGLTLGGGISFFSNMYGWACDNIASYEVVMANGEVISASATSHSDLYWALRGGANNFGLVTKFDMISYPHHNSLMWVGKLLHPLQASPGLIKAFVDFGHQDSDSNATVLFSYVYLQDQKQYVISSETDYAVPVPEGKSPPAFDAFFNEPDAIETRKETKRVVEAIEEHSTSNPSGKRQTYWTATFVLDSSLAEQLVYIWQEELETIQHRVTGIVPVLTFQIVTARMMQYMKKYGGNALGLDGTQGPLMIVTPSAMWTDSTHDDEVLKAYANWLSRATARAQEMGLRHRYLYTNYASQFQNPMAGYGTKNLERLKSIARKYDPEGVFQSLQPGYFKL